MKMAIPINKDFDREPLERIGTLTGGADGLVYKLGDDKVAKFQWPTNWESWLWRVSPSGNKIRKEYEIARELYDAGISVPNPYGVFKLRKPKGEDWSEIWVPRRYPAFVMEYKEGGIPYPKYLDFSTQRKIEELVRIEREKVADLGFRTSDSLGWENTLWVPKEERIYLIDFTRWELSEK